MKYNRFTKKLQNKIKKLNLDYEDTGGLLVCLYLYGGCPEEDCAKLFEFTLDSIIDYLKYEQIYDYKICQNCEHLKERNDIEFKRKKDRKNTNVCTECKKLNRKKYDKKHFEQIKEYMEEYNKEYYKENKERIQEQHKEYYKENKERIQEQHKEYYKENKENMKEYQQEYYEKNKENMKEYRNSPASEELLQRLELYEELKGNQIKCRYCGDWYTPTNQEVRDRLQGILKNDTSYIYCSQECKEACSVYRRRLYPEGFKPASSREVNPILRQLVFERDQYICQKCFTHKDQLNCPLHCHHITPYVDSPIEGNDPENCITLCKDCHKEVHQIPGCGYNELRCG